MQLLLNRLVFDKIIYIKGFSQKVIKNDDNAGKGIFFKCGFTSEQINEISEGNQAGLDVSRRTALLLDICHQQAKIMQNQVRTEDFMFEYASNDMEAYITVLAKGKYITRERLLEILEQNHIRKGVLEETVQKIVDGRYGNKPLLIAKGQIPHRGEDGWYEFFFRTDLNRKPKVLLGQGFRMDQDRRTYYATLDG